MTHRAGIYCRLSHAPDGSLEKVERQEADCRQLAAQLGWEVVDVYMDNSRSAWQRNRRRPEWERLMADIASGRLDAIIVYHGDRLVRQPWDLETLLRLADERRLRLASVTGTRDLSSEDDRFILRIEVAQACRESANTSRRVRRGWAARAARGLPAGGGKRPHGWGVQVGTRTRVDPVTGEQTEVPVYDMTQPVPEEQEVQVEAARRLLAGQTDGGVLRWMNSVSRTTGGHAWIGKTMWNVLLSPRIAGLVRHGDTLHEAVWEPVISREMWEDLHALHARAQQRYGFPGRERVYLLSGVATCATGHGLRVKPTGGRNRPGARLYWCAVKGCPTRVGRNVEHLDRFVEGAVLGLLGDGDFIAGLGTPEDSGTAADIVALERRKQETREQLASLADHPNLSADLLVQALASFDRRIGELRNAAARSARQRLLLAHAGITQEAWRALPVDVRSALVAACYRVTVLPTQRRGPGFDTGAVRLDPVEE